MNQLEEFKALGLSDDILTAIAKKGFETPRPFRASPFPTCSPPTKHIIAQAQTGTGKTAAFGLPIIQMLTSRRNIPQAIVLVPTRELALQVTQELISFNTHDLSIALIYGGASMTGTAAALEKRHRHRRRHAGPHPRPHPPGHARPLGDRLPGARRGGRNAQHGFHRGYRRDHARHDRPQTGATLLGHDARPHRGAGPQLHARPRPPEGRIAARHDRPDEPDLFRGTRRRQSSTP